MNAKGILLGFSCGVVFTFVFMVASTFNHGDVVPFVNRLRKRVNIAIPSKEQLTSSMNSIVELARNKSREAKISYAKITAGSYSLNDVVQFASKKTNEARASFAKVTKDFYKVGNKMVLVGNKTVLGANKLKNNTWQKITNQTRTKKGANKRKSSVSGSKGTRNKYADAVRRARKNLLDRCPSLNADSIRQVGITPGSIDIVITTVNFTTPINDKTAKKYFNYPLDPVPSRKACDPRATVAQWTIDQYVNKSFKCDYTSNEPCCVKIDKKNKKEQFVWGKCTAASTDNKFCRCKDCFDYRLRRNDLLFNEVRFQLRSLEHNGVFVKSDAQPLRRSSLSAMCATGGTECTKIRLGPVLR